MKIQDIAKEFVKRLKLQPEECFLGTVERTFDVGGFKVTIRPLTADETREVRELVRDAGDMLIGDIILKKETLKRAITKIEKDKHQYTNIEEIVKKMPNSVIDELYLLYAGLDAAIQLLIHTEDMDFFDRKLLELRRYSEQRVLDAMGTGETSSSTNT